MAKDVTTPRKRHRILRAAGWAVLVLIVLLIAAYFVATSAAFFKGVILPRVSQSLNAKVTVTDASIHPFKEVILRGLTVKAGGETPLVTAPEVRLRYSLLDIIGGHINIDEVAISSPVVTVVENPDGSRNFDSIVNAQKQQPGKEKKEGRPAEKPSKPAQIDLKKFTLTDGTLRYIHNYNNRDHDTSEVTHLAVSLENLKNNGTAKLTLSADAAVRNDAPAPGTNGAVAAKATGDFSLGLGPNLKPLTMQGGIRADVSQAIGSMAEMAATAADLKFDVTPEQIKQVALKFSKGSQPLGQVLASGPFDMAKLEGKVTVEVLSIDKRVLNLAGAASGIDFGPTTLNSTNVIAVTNNGSVISASGEVALSKLQLVQQGKTTPMLDLGAHYDMTVDTASSNAVLRQLTLDGRQNGNQFLKSSLSSPMSFNWGNAQNAVGDSTLDVAIQNFNLADWKAFLDGAASAGLVNANLKLLSQRGGKSLNFNLDSRVSGLDMKMGSNEVSHVSASLQANGQAANMSKFNLEEFKASLGRQGRAILDASGSGTYDETTGSADITTTVQSSIPGLLELSPQPDVQVSSGDANLKVHVGQHAGSGGSAVQTVTGNLSVKNLTAKMGKSSLRNFGAAAQLDIGKDERQIEIRKLGGNLSEDGQPGGSFDVSGTYATNGSLQMKLTLADVNQNALRPFLEPALSGKNLKSIAINGSASVQYLPDGNSSVKATMAVTNLVVLDPKNQIPATPLEARIGVDIGLQQKVADVRQIQLGLTPTERAKNEITLSGRLDMTRTNAIEGNLKVASDALDVTRYYDLVSGGQHKTKGTAANTGESAPAAPAASPGSGLPEEEPAAEQLPLKNFSAAVNIGKLYVRETEVSNFQATASIDGGRVVLKPCALALNGAPVSANADIDLGVKGYKYQAAFDMKAVPLAPLVNSFDPDQKGQIGGALTAEANLAGAGITGAGLKENLKGKFDVTSTNLNFSI
ncbi:MAG TPA: AsmA family protein, partial [Verrucomicrobiae bacterium]|nr:AsmA family protein [Verrucomicrobiae bacterium]